MLAPIELARHAVAKRLADERSATYLIPGYLRGEMDDSVAVQTALSCLIFARPRMTKEEFNALPENAQRYIMMLETNADPSGTVRSEMMLRDVVEALEIKAVTEQWHCNACLNEFQYDGDTRPNCPRCKAFDQYTYKGPCRIAKIQWPGRKPSTEQP